MDNILINIVFVNHWMLENSTPCGNMNLHIIHWAHNAVFMWHPHQFHQTSREYMGISCFVPSGYCLTTAKAFAWEELKLVSVQLLQLFHLQLWTIPVACHSALVWVMDPTTIVHLMVFSTSLLVVVLTIYSATILWRLRWKWLTATDT